MDTKQRQDLKLCVNCKYCRVVPCGDISATYYECLAKAPDVNVVTGDEKYSYCSVVRNKECKGQWYVKKEPIPEQVQGMFRKIITWISNNF